MMARPKTFKNSSSSSNLLHLFTMNSSNNNNSSTKNSSPLSSSSSRTHHHYHQMKLCSSPNFHLFFLSLLTVFAFFGVSKIISLTIDYDDQDSIIKCSPALFHSRQMLSAAAALAMTPLSNVVDDVDTAPTLSKSVMVPLPAHGLDWNISDEEREFWRQPHGDGYRPCLVFSIGYRRASAKIAKEKRRLLLVVASGGLNQQRNQIADAVVIARILDAALVVPSLQVNLIWGDESEFSDLFDVEFFKKTLRADVRVVSSLPSSHLIPKQPVENQIPIGVSPQWIRARFLQKLRCKVLLRSSLSSTTSIFFCSCSRNARIYYAGGEPFGGTEALEPLKREFPNMITKEALAKGGELDPYANRPSALAAIDYIVSLSSDVFMPSHGGNMGRVMQGQRTYSGHRKFIMPNKRAMLPFFENKSLPEEEFGKIMRQLHKTSMKPPQFRKYKRVHDVIAYPVPECMCNS